MEDHVIASGYWSKDRGGDPTPARYNPPHPPPPGKMEWNRLSWRVKGEEIPILARMFAIVDAFDALTSKRPDRQKTMTTLKALEYLREQTGILFDPKIVNVFEKLVTESQPDLLTSE